MRTTRLFLIGLLVFASQIAMFGQETPQGKKAAEDFWKFLNEGRLVAAEGRLESLKRREPNFDASKMQKAIDDAKAAKDTKIKDQRDALMSRVNAGNELDELFFRRNIQADSSDTQASVDAEIDTYSKKADAVLAVDRASIQSELERALGTLRNDLQRDAETNAKLVNGINESTDAKLAEAAYYELLLRRSYWDTARRIFPNEAGIVKAYDSINSSINGLGTAAQRSAAANKNMNAKIDAARMPKALRRDANMEKQLQNTFISMAQTRNLNYTFLKAVVIVPDYGIVRNQLTGIVVARNLFGSIAFKDKDGKCKFGDFRMDQNYVGGSFSGSWYGDFSGFISEIRCENLNK